MCKPSVEYLACPEGLDSGIRSSAKMYHIAIKPAADFRRAVDNSAPNYYNVSMFGEGGAVMARLTGYIADSMMMCAFACGSSCDLPDA